jgi:hypothetical protein
VTVEFRVDQIGREVLARVLEVVVDLREQVVELASRPVRCALLRRQVDAFEHVLDELAEPRPSSGGKPSMSAMTRMGMC